VEKGCLDDLNVLHFFRSWIL